MLELVVIKRRRGWDWRMRDKNGTVIAGGRENPAGCPVSRVSRVIPVDCGRVEGNRYPSPLGQGRRGSADECLDKLAARPLAPPANAGELAGLDRAVRARRRPSRSCLAWDDDPLRGADADIGRRCDARGRRRRVERSVTGWRRRYVGAKWRNPRGVADSAGVADHTGVGRAVRNPVDRRIAGASRSSRWRTLRQGATRRHPAAKQYEADKRRMAGHWISSGLPTQTIMWGERSRF